MRNQSLILMFSRAIATLVVASASMQGVAQAPSTATDGKRFALVIGNRSYIRGPLDNPGNDAFVMDAVLRQLGFAVELRYDLTRSRMNSELDELSKRAKGAEAVLVYYSGHGVQDRGKNFLLPVDTMLAESSSIPEMSVSVDKALDVLKRSNARVTIMILDACRNTPSENGRSRGDAGLEMMKPAEGTLIAFSTAPGAVAADGKVGGNSVFTDALAKTLAEPKRSAEGVFKRVREIVATVSQRKQVPWLNSGLTGDFIFNSGEKAVLIPVIPANATTIFSTSRARDVSSQSAAPSAHAWHETRSPQEWQQIDREIAQRVKHISVDDLSELTGRAYDGDAKAQVILGDSFQFGIRTGAGEIRSNPDAMRWYQQAANRGFPLAQVRIGEMYYESRGVDRNVAESKRWLEMAAAQGLERAKINLLQLKMQGPTTPLDPKELSEAWQGFLRSHIPKPSTPTPK